MNLIISIAQLRRRIGLSQNLATVDGGFSFDAEGLAHLVRGARAAWSALGVVNYGPSEYGPFEAERGSRRFRRGLYFVRDVAAGEVIGEAAVSSLRPAAELDPDAIGDVVGQRTKRAVRRGEPVARDHVA